MNDTPRQLNYTFAESARALRVSVSLLRKMARAGRIKVVHIGRCVRVPREELLRLSGVGRGVRSAESLNE